MVGGHAALEELLQLVLLQQPERGTALHLGYGALDGAVADGDLLDLAVRLASSARHEGEAPYALLVIVGCLSHAGAGADQSVALGSRGVVATLGAPLAVLGAVATLGIDDGAGIEGLAEEVLGQLVGSLVEGLLVGVGE